MRRTALITGASRGLGAVIATFLARSGYRVVITARGANALDDVARRLRKEGADVTPIAGDVTDAAHRRRLLEALSDGLDILVNNASDLGPSPLPALASYPLDALRGVLEANVVAPIA